MSNQLNKAGQVTLNASGAGQVSLGPSVSAGPARWTVDALLWQTSRPGVAPIPRIQVFLDNTDASGLQCQSYDGSFGSASGTVSVSRGSNLIAVWTGGQAGDVASISVTGVTQ